jgi:hypothetical protein
MLMVNTHAVAVAMIGLLISCGSNKQVSGYRVLSYDGVSHQWTILYTDGKRIQKRLVLVCEIGNVKRGQDACHLDVGRLMVQNPLPSLDRTSEYLEIDEPSDNTLEIWEGAKVEGSKNRGGFQLNHQQFRIMKSELVN